MNSTMAIDHYFTEAEYKAAQKRTDRTHELMASGMSEDDAMRTVAEEARMTSQDEIGCTVQDKLRFIADKLDEARAAIEVNHPSKAYEEAKAWADNEALKWRGPFDTIIRANPRESLSAYDYAWKEYVLWKFNHLDDDLDDDETGWYISLKDFFEGQLLSD
jgi:uncharacterized protein YoaH (UPF0181 family)